MVDEKALAEVVAAELDVAEMVLTDPLTLRRLKAERIARAVLAALSPGSTGETEGWVLVPKEPTDEMLWQGGKVRTSISEVENPLATWRAMLSAAGER